MNRQLHLVITGLLVIVVAMASVSCKTLESTGEKAPPPTTRPDAQKKVKEIDAKIAKVDDEISFTRDALREENITLISALGGGIGPQGMHENPYEPRDTIIIMTSANIRAGEKRLDELKRQRQGLEREKANALSQAASCFPADMMVRMADGKPRHIGDVRVGDVILAYDIGSQADTARRVTRAYESMNNHYYLINGDLRVTGGERFLSTRGWTTARDLKPGDTIRREGGMLPIETIALIHEDLPVYNLQVETSHTFYVTAGGEAYLVHNTSGGSGGGSGGGGGGGNGGK